MLFLIAGSCFALPNLRLNWVQYDPVQGIIAAEVFNDSEETADNAKVAFYADGAIIAIYPDEQTIALGPKSTMTAIASFPFDGNNHEFYAMVDPNNELEEIDETDNSVIERVFFEYPEPVPPDGDSTVVEADTGLMNALMAVAIIAAIALALLFFMKYAVKKDDF